MESGAIDICAEYTGTAWTTHLGEEHVPGLDNSSIYLAVKREDDRNGIIWLGAIWNNNTYALASTAEFVEAHKLETLSDLAALYRENEGMIETFVSSEFGDRMDGLPDLREYYHFSIHHDYLTSGAPLMAPVALEGGSADVSLVFGTEPKVWENGWYVYTDDEAFFPPYDLTPSVRADVLEKYPEISDILNKLVDSFPGGGEPSTSTLISATQRIWQELNAEVDISLRQPADVARDYLVREGLIEE